MINITETQTIANVKRLLSAYSKMDFRAYEPIKQRLTASYTHAPRSKTNTKTSFENAVIKQIEAKEIIQDINLALNQIDELYKDCIMRIYGNYVQSFQAREVLSYMNHSAIYRATKKAYLEFAKVYKNGELIVE